MTLQPVRTTCRWRYAFQQNNPNLKTVKFKLILILAFFSSITILPAQEGDVTRSGRRASKVVAGAPVAEKPESVSSELSRRATIIDENGKQIIIIEARGDGYSETDAIRQGIISAVRQAVGVLVESQQLITNDKLLEDS